MPVPAAAATPVVAAGKGAATKAAIASGAISAGAGLASGIAQAAMMPDSNPRPGKASMPNASPGAVGARAGGSNLFSGRPDISGPQPRNSLAMQMLKGGYR